MKPAEAEKLWGEIEGYAAYSFNKSHSAAYSLLSFQCAWMKTHFPVEFLAACLTLMPQDKLLGVLVDAKRLGVDVSMPDVNISTNKFEILHDHLLSVPLSAVKGISANATKAILDARAAGPFTSKADLTGRVVRRMCNVGHIEKLDQVGAFARVEPGQVAANDPSRIKVQKDLLPGLVIDAVPIDREMALNDTTMLDTARMVKRMRKEHADDGIPVAPVYGSAGRFMVVVDAPTNGEEQQGQFTWGRGFQYVADSLSALGWSRSDAYWTGVLKRPKSERTITVAELKRYRPILMEEVLRMRPPVILALGAQAVRTFLPDFKGRTDEEAGRVYYLEEIDANLVIGFNPGSVYFNPEKQEMLDDCFNVIAKLLPAI